MKTPDPGRLVPWLVSAALVCALFFNGLDLSWFAVSLLLLLLWFTLNGIGLYRTGLATGSRALPVMVMLFWLWLGLGIPFTPVRYLGAVNFWWLGALPLGYLAFLLTPDREKFWQRLLPLLLWIGIALSGYALYQYFWLQSPPNATFFTKNSLAAFLSLLLFPALAQVLVASRLRDRWLGALAVVLFAFLLGLIQSRGAWLGLAGGLVLLYGLGLGGTRHTRWLTGLALIVAGFVAAALVIPWVPEAGGGLLERVVSLRDTASAGHSRFVIWQPAWELFLQHPWRGIGLGTYFMAIPPLLHPRDHSAHFYVHNDYLQLALETGLPGLLLLLGIYGVVLALLVRVLARVPRGDPRRTALLGLFAALFAFALHSAFTFNFYVMPSMLLAGLLLGRLHTLGDVLAGQAPRVLDLSTRLRPWLYYMLLLLAMLLPAGYFASLGLGHAALVEGRRLLAEGRLPQAHLALLRAQRLTPLVDSPWFLDADLLRRSAELVGDHPRRAAGLLDEAEEKVRAALRRNPLRPQSWYILGKITGARQPLDTARQQELYREALRRDPRFVPARLALARLLLRDEQTEAAYTVLAAGLDYAYRRVTPTLLEYVELSMTTAGKLGETGLALLLSSRLVEWRSLSEPPLTPPPVPAP